MIDKPLPIKPTILVPTTGPTFPTKELTYK